MQDLDSPPKRNMEALIWDENDPDRDTFVTQSNIVPEDTTSTPFTFITKRLSPGSMKGSIFTLVCSTMGTGLLLIPNAVSESGIIWSIIQMAICALLGYYSLVILIKCSDSYKLYSYQSLAEATYGAWYKQVTNVTFFLVCWGAAIAILILVSQLIAKALGNFDTDKSLPAWMTDQFSIYWPLIVGTVFVWPLSLAKELKQLRYICFVSFCFVLILVAVVLYESFNLEDFDANLKACSLFELEGITSTFTTVMFAFTCHPNALDVFRELQRSNQRRMRKVVGRTIIIAISTYCIIGVFGYITFALNLKVLNSTNLSNGVILFAYGYDSNGNPRSFPIMVFIMLILNGISMIVLEPLVIKPAKDSLENMLFQKEGEVVPKYSLLRHFLLVTFTVYTAVAVSMYVKSLPRLINVMGASLLTIICFVQPTSFYIKLKEKEPLKGHKLACWILLVVSIFFGIFASIKSAMSLFETI